MELEAIGIWPHSRRLEATLNFVGGLSRHVCGAEADNDAHEPIPPCLGSRRAYDFVSPPAATLRSPTLRVDDPELASYLRFEERELEAGELN